LGDVNPPPQLLEFKHSSDNDGPSQKDRRKAMIEQIHFLTHAKKTVEVPCGNIGTVADIKFQIRLPLGHLE
jgi:hypothetical protein